jgi:hypothetical protein
MPSGIELWTGPIGAEIDSNRTKYMVLPAILSTAVASVKLIPP